MTSETYARAYELQEKICFLKAEKERWMKAESLNEKTLSLSFEDEPGFSRKTSVSTAFIALPIVRAFALQSIDKELLPSEEEFNRL